VCVVWVGATQSAMAQVKALKSVEDFAARHGFFTHGPSRSMQCQLGEYAGTSSNAMPRVSATAWTSAQRWERAWSRTTGLGTCQPRAPSCLRN
jgi:hypothetical protein